MTKTLWYWHKNRNINQNRIENAEINPQLYGQLTFDKEGKNIQWETAQSLQQMMLERLVSYMQRRKLDHFLSPYTKVNSKWMKDLNVRQEDFKILEKAGKSLFDLDHNNFLLNTSLEAREIKAQMNYWDLITIKSFCTVKETISKIKGNQWNGRRHLQMTYVIKR